MDEYFTNRYGCISPLHTNKLQNAHCTLNNSMLSIYLQLIETTVFENKCPLPCATMSVSFEPPIFGLESRNESKTKIFFKRKVKVNKSIWNYTLVSLLAEVGGYVGLLLGVSLMDIGLILEKMVHICKRYYKNVKRI